MRVCWVDVNYIVGEICICGGDTVSTMSLSSNLIFGITCTISRFLKWVYFFLVTILWNPHSQQAASLFSFIWTCSLLGYVVSSIGPPKFEFLKSVPWQIHPLLLILFSTCCFILTQIKARWWLTKTLARIVTAPFWPVEFRDFFLADQLLSIVIVLYDLEFSICFFLYDAWTGTGKEFLHKVSFTFLKMFVWTSISGRDLWLWFSPLLGDFFSVSAEPTSLEITGST